MRSLSGPRQDQPADPIIVHPTCARCCSPLAPYAEGARAGLLDRAAGWTKPISIPTKRSQRECCRHRGGAAHAHRQGLHHRCNGFATTNLPTGLRRPRLIRQQAWSSSCATPASTHDLRRHEHRQSLDLLGRKVLGDNGAKLKKFGKLVAEFIEEEAATDEKMAEFVNPLADLGDKVTKLTTELGMKAFQNPTRWAPRRWTTCASCGHWCSPTSSPGWPRSRCQTGLGRPFYNRQTGGGALLLRQAAAGDRRSSSAARAPAWIRQLMAMDAKPLSEPQPPGDAR